jgi:phosphoenolpyruvate carboxylase
MTLEEMMEVTEYAVEVNSFEQSHLWRRYEYETTWQEILSGYGVSVPDGGFVSLLWGIIEGKYVLFYDVTSNTVNFQVVESWIKSNMDIKLMVNSNNFHRIIADIKKR